MYLAVTYVAPESSPIHNIYNDNIFKLIEADKFSFNELGKVFLTGDFNSRVSRKCDFIENDRRINDERRQTATEKYISHLISLLNTDKQQLLIKLAIYCIKAHNVRNQNIV